VASVCSPIVVGVAQGDIVWLVVQLFHHVNVGRFLHLPLDAESPTLAVLQVLLQLLLPPLDNQQSNTSTIENKKYQQGKPESKEY
jgi:hypothetical protein